MTKILLIPDVHYCPTQFNGPGPDGVPQRLSELNDSMDWAARLGRKEGCDISLQMGDFFDNPSRLSGREIVAAALAWSRFPGRRIVLRGNHDFNARYDASKIFSLCGNVYDKPSTVYLNESEAFLAFLPYIRDREEFQEKLDGLQKQAGGHGIEIKRYLFIHQPVEGFIDIDPSAVPLEWFDLDVWSAVYSGHYHETMGGKGIHYLGSLTNTAFVPKGRNKEKGVWVLDVATGELVFHRNPHAPIMLTTTPAQLQEDSQGLDPAQTLLKLKYSDPQELQELDWETVGKFRGSTQRLIREDRSDELADEEVIPEIVSGKTAADVLDAAKRSLDAELREDPQFMERFDALGRERVLRIQ